MSKSIKVLPEALASKAMLAKYRKLYRLAKPTMKEGDEAKLREAFCLALETGEGAQDRPNTTQLIRSAAISGISTTKTVPIAYPIDLAMVVAEELGLGFIFIVCALLYGAPQKVTPKSLRGIFGNKVVEILYKLTKLDAISQAEKVTSPPGASKVAIALVEDAPVVLIKIADNLQKMRMLANVSTEQQARLLAEAKYIYIPIAHRLGLNVIKATLEDLHLKFTNPRIYFAIAGQLQSTQKAREGVIRRFKRPIQEALKKRGFVFTLKARVKSITSIRNKMEALSVSLDQVYDIFAIRIILDTPLAQEKLSCWQVYELVTSRYKTHPTKFRNWLSYPRPNGYQALHTTVMSKGGEWVEVQIRTKRMDEVAEKGHAAHWKYKEGGKNDQLGGLDTQLAQLRAALEQNPQKVDELLDAPIDVSLV